MISIAKNGNIYCFRVDSIFPYMVLYWKMDFLLPLLAIISLASLMAIVTSIRGELLVKEISPYQNFNYFLQNYAIK